MNIIFDKVSNHYPNGNCSTLNEAMEYTKKLMTFLENENLLNETGIEALEDWNSSSQIESCMLKEEGNNLLSIYHKRWNKHHSVSDNQEKVSGYWKRRLNDLREYNKISVRNESSFCYLKHNKDYMDLPMFLETVDANLAGNVRHLLFECETNNGKLLVKRTKAMDENYNKISAPILEFLTEGFQLCEFNKDNTILDNCKYIKEIWNESSRVYKYDMKIQPTRAQQYFKVQ